MRTSAVITIIMSLISGCGDHEDRSSAALGDETETETSSETTTVRAGKVVAADNVSARDRSIEGGTRWALHSKDGETELALVRPNGHPALRILCAGATNRLLVNVPGFDPIGSEERLSFGSEGEVMALVADTRGDAQRGGVSGTGEIPGNLRDLVRGPMSASYGAQISGPHTSPPQHMSRAFLAACNERFAVDPTEQSAAISADPCMMQGSTRLTLMRLRAVGTEPFWGAQINGRCVTYSHPDDQKGVRVWTRYTAGPDGGTWSGALHGRLFELRTRSSAQCSDGMSDKRYPFAVDLRVQGENRHGCAEPG